MIKEANFAGVCENEDGHKSPTQHEIKIIMESLNDIYRQGAIDSDESFCSNCGYVEHDIYFYDLSEDQTDVSLFEWDITKNRAIPYQRLGRSRSFAIALCTRWI